MKGNGSEGKGQLYVPLPLPLGEVAERSEDGEGYQTDRKPLSVTCGDSSPFGRAKSLHLGYIGIKNGAYRHRYAPFIVLPIFTKLSVFLFLYRSTPRNFLARMPTTKDRTATLMLMIAISENRDLKGSSWATEV